MRELLVVWTCLVLFLAIVGYSVKDVGNYRSGLENHLRDMHGLERR